MDLVLTHYGHRLVTQQLVRTEAGVPAADEDLALLAAVQASLALPDDGSARDALDERLL
jgi:hypothetical protein